jgi:hypothetical protein
LLGPLFKFSPLICTDDTDQKLLPRIFADERGSTLFKKL